MNQRGIEIDLGTERLLHHHFTGGTGKIVKTWASQGLDLFLVKENPEESTKVIFFFIVIIEKHPFLTESLLNFSLTVGSQNYRVLDLVSNIKDLNWWSVEIFIKVLLSLILSGRLLGE